MMIMAEKRLVLVKLMLMLLSMVMMIRVAMATLHRVGENHGWNPNVNYSVWSNHDRFYAGDWLIFYFDKHYYNVLEVNKTSYEKCNDQNFIKNITRGGRDVVQLTEARPYYYLSGGGYCFHGMKVAINVEIPQVAPAPAPAVKSGSPSNAAGTYYMLFVLVLILVNYTLMLWDIIN